MTIMTFGDLSVDMRAPDRAYGIAPLEEFTAFLLAFVPVRQEVAEAPGYLTITMVDAQGAVVTVIVAGDAAGTELYEMTIIAADVQYTLRGRFAVDASEAFVGSVTSVRVIRDQDKSLLTSIEGFDVPIDGTLPAFPDDAQLLAGADRIASGAGNDVLLGYAGDDALAAGAGNDTLDGGPGADVMDGGAGDDVYVRDDAGDRIVEAPGGGVDEVRSAVSTVLDAEVERVLLTGDAAINAIGNALDNRLVGNAQANSLIGLEGSDTLDGGGGWDTAIGSRASAGVQIAHAAGRWTVRDAAGSGDVETLSNVEVLAFTDRSFVIAAPGRTTAPAYNTDAAFLFDAVWYQLDNADAVPAIGVDAALQHYFTVGAAQGRAPNAWFDAAYYGQRWADLAALDLDAATLFRHYNLYGVWEGRSAGPVLDTFDGARYLRDNPDVAAYVDAHLGDFLGSRSNGAIAHYVIYGAGEGRAAYDAAGAAIAIADYTVLI